MKTEVTKERVTHSAGAVPIAPPPTAGSVLDGPKEKGLPILTMPLSTHGGEQFPISYFRDQKSLVPGILQAFGGRGFYVEGDQLATLLELFRQTSRV